MTGLAWWLTAAAALLCAVLAVVSARRSRRRLAEQSRLAVELARHIEAAVLDATRARHLQLAGGDHGCCRLVDGAQGDQQCGLWCCHDGPCLPYTPGEYLPEPMLHPLDLLRMRRAVFPWWRCPLCSRLTASDRAEDPVSMIRWDGAGWREPETETAWEFTPCGCVGRVIA